MKHEDFMREAIRISQESMEKGGGPFGAVIVKDGQIIARSGNTVALENDPTAHAEVNAIRQATEYMDDFDLSGCELYSSCEPCPMCLEPSTGPGSTGCGLQPPGKMLPRQALMIRSYTGTSRNPLKNGQSLLFRSSGKRDARPSTCGKRRRIRFNIDYPIGS